MNRVERIRHLLQSLQPTLLEVIDDSHKHLGHEGAKSGAGHFTVKIASPLFMDKTRIQCHQLVYQAVDEMIKGEIHALAIHVIDNNKR
jgi:BolA protein